jgi:hypothetical protein
MTPVLLTGFLPEEQLLAELMKDPVVKQALDDSRPKTFSELVKMADGGCEMDFHPISDSFAFHHIKGDKVAVQIGLPHGCEVMRGHYTELGIYLRLPDQLKEMLEQADRKKTLGKYKHVKPDGNL